MNKKGNFHSSNTDKEIRDLWRTPKSLFQKLDEEFGFKLDVAASSKNTLCDSFIDEAQNALNSEWITDGPIFCNPPYSGIRQWIEKAAEQSEKQKQTVVMLLPVDTSVKWFSLALKTADEVRFIVNGRIKFVNAMTGDIAKTAMNKGSLFIIWRYKSKGFCRFTTIERDELQG